METLKANFTGKVGSAAISGLIGLYFLLSPNTAFDTIVMILAAVMLFIGIVKIILFLGGTGIAALYNTAPIGGIILTVVGFVLFVRPGIISGIIGYVLGFIMLSVGIRKLIAAYTVKNITGNMPVITVIMGAVGVILGIAVIINPFSVSAAVLMLTGIGLIVYAISEGIAAYDFYRKIKDYEDDIIDQ